MISSGGSTQYFNTLEIKESHRARKEKHQCLASLDARPYVEVAGFKASG